MNLKILFPFLLGLLPFLPTLKAQEWVRTFSFPDENFEATFSAITPEGDVIVTDSRPDADSVLVAKVSASGTILWENLLFSGTVSANTNPIGCGGIYFNPDGSMQLINNRLAPGYDIISLDEGGTELSRIPITTNSWSMRTLRLANGDFMITRTPGSGLSQVKPDGTIVFSSNPGTGTGTNFTNTIVQADNGHYLMYVNGYYQSAVNGIILHADEFGQQLDVYNMPYESRTQSIAKGVDGHFVAVGSNDSLVFVKMSLDGTVLNQTLLDDPFAPFVSRDIVALPDGYLVAGSKGGVSTIWRLDINGEVVQEQIMLQNSESVFTSLTVGDGGYTVYGSGSIRPFGSNQSDVFVAKFNLLPLTNYGTVSGTVRKDPEGDCNVDLSEETIANMAMIASSTTNTFYALTNTDGEYKFILPTEDYLIKSYEQYPYLENCSAGELVTIAGLDNHIVDFWKKELYECPLLLAHISNGRMRKCSDNNYSVAYANVGTATAVDSYLEIELDPNLAYVSSTIPLSGSSGNTLTFELGDLQPGDYSSFTLTVEMIDCEDLVIDQVLCSSAHIYPDSVCGDYSNWSGASMEVGAKCEGDSARLFITNSGTATTSDIMDYVIIEDNVILMQGGQIFNQLDTIWAINPANGSTWRGTSEQEPGHPGFSSPGVTLEGCGENDNGSFSVGYWSTLPTDDADYAYDIECNPVIAAFDPNVKEAFPTGVGAEHFINQNTDLEYLLGFQNTGNDTAFLVVLRDTLPLELNPATVRVGAASHPFTWSLEGTGELVFQFPNILLPDSTTNEPESHGWVKFRIAQDPDLPLGSIIENSVGIYFDFNEPVITNTTFHTVGKNFLEVINDISPMSERFGELLVFPNPSLGDVVFELPEKVNDDVQFILYDQMGRAIMQNTFIEKQFVFKRNNLSPGIYFYKVEIGVGGFYSGKVILK